MIDDQRQAEPRGQGLGGAASRFSGRRENGRRLPAHGFGDEGVDVACCRPDQPHTVRPTMRGEGRSPGQSPPRDRGVVGDHEHGAMVAAKGRYPIDRLRSLPRTHGRSAPISSAVMRGRMGMPAAGGGGSPGTAAVDGRPGTVGRIMAPVRPG